MAENRVRLIQQLTAHPEVGEYLGTLERQNTFLAGLKSVASERFGYFVGGAAGRAALVGTLGLLAAPAVAAVSGGFMGYRRAKDTLIEQDRQARRGKDAVTKAAPGDGAGWFRKLITKPEAISQEKLRAGKRQMVRASVSETESDGDGRKRGLAERLDIINERIAKLSSDDAASMNKELGALAARVEYVKNKLDSDQVNFGDGTEGIRSRVMLLEALSRAEMNLGVFAGGKDSGSVSDRFDRMFGQAQKDEDTRVKGARDAYVRYETGRGMVMAGTISLLGAGVMSAAHETTAALHHVPGSGSAKVHLDAVYGKEEIIEDDPMQVGGVVKQATRSHVPGSGAVPETAGQAPTGAGTARIATETLRQAAAVNGTRVVETAGRTYAETAKPGEGLTHLARRAFAEYAKEKNIGLSPEQKVYIEDYLQKKLGHAGPLRSGEKLEFTKEMMDEAIGKAKGLSVTEQENLRHYARQIDEFRSSVGPTPKEMPIEAVTPRTGNVVLESSEPVARSGSSAVAPAEVEGGISKSTELPPVLDGVLSDTGEAAQVAGGADTVSMGVDRVMKTVTSDVAREYLNDPSHMEPFRTARDMTIRGLFPSETGGIDRDGFLKVGKMASRNVLRDCLLSIGDPKRSSWGNGYGEERLRRIGKFMLAMNDRGVVPVTALGEEEYFLAYIERVSVFVAEHSDESLQSMVSSISDSRLDALAKAAIEMEK
ncbi:MAG: hypothetical protein HGA33_04075 [Candidatus Moranbacteria bacterium]|nr:hypothetical protein [Candidatus Moranbacteria bacterium]